MGVQSRVSQQFRASQTEWQNAPKARINVVVTAPAVGTSLTLVAPTEAQLGVVRGPVTPDALLGEVRLPGAPFYNLVVERPTVIPPATDADVVQIVIDDGTGGLLTTYTTPVYGGTIEILDIPAAARIRVASVSASTSAIDYTYVIPQLLQY